MISSDTFHEKLCEKIIYVKSRMCAHTSLSWSENSKTAHSYLMIYHLFG